MTETEQLQSWERDPEWRRKLGLEAKESESQIVPERVSHEPLDEAPIEQPSNRVECQ